MKDQYDFGGAGEQEEEVTTNVETTTEGDDVNQEVTAETSTTESDESQSEAKENNELETSGTEESTDEDQSDKTEQVNEITEGTDELDDELKELEALLKENVTFEDKEENNIEVSNKLKEAINKMKSLANKIDKLELEKAELTKFGENANLSPELIIIKANYNKAMKGDEAAKNKIKEMISNDLGLEVTDQKQVFVSNSIAGGTDVNTESSDGEGFGFVM